MDMWRKLIIATMGCGIVLTAAAGCSGGGGRVADTVTALEEHVGYLRQAEGASAVTCRPADSRQEAELTFTLKSSLGHGIDYSITQQYEAGLRFRDGRWAVESVRQRRSDGGEKWETCSPSDTGYRIVQALLHIGE